MATPVPPTPSRTPWGAIISLVSALAYGVSPLDLIPDILILVGWWDDAILVPLLLVIAGVSFFRHKARMKQESTGTSVIPAQARSVNEPPVIPNDYESATAR